MDGTPAGRKDTMEQLQGTLARYAWGTHDAIPSLLGFEADGEPVAEFWLGAHPLSPSRVGGVALDAALEADPAQLGERSGDEFGSLLPFLMKVLSARHALSLQAHPSREQAVEGFAEEENRGIARDAAERVYRDDWPKPEILVALDEFHTLYGFRSPRITWQLFNQLGVNDDVLKLLAPLNARGGEAALQEVFLDILAIEGNRLALVHDVLRAARAHEHDPGDAGCLARTALEIDATFPADPGIIAAMLMNHVILRPGEAVYVPAGCMHAHLRGTGIEVMASSDNVLRGGLTRKHIAVDELVRVVDFGWTDPEIITGTEVSAGAFDYPTGCPEFDLWRLELTPGVPVAVPRDGFARIALVTEGAASFRAGGDTLQLDRGQALFLTAHDVGVEARGAGQVFLAGPGLA